MLTMIGGVSEFFSDQLAAQALLRAGRRLQGERVRRAACRHRRRGSLRARQQRRRHDRRPRRRRAGPSSVLHGMLHCGNCGSTLHSDRTQAGYPLYRERMAEYAVSDGCTRTARSRRRSTGPGSARSMPAFARGPHRRSQRIGDAAGLFGDIPALWEAVGPEERRRLVAPLIERVYVDIESTRVGAFTPSPAFRSLLAAATQRKSQSRAVILSPDETRSPEVWRVVETGEAPSPVSLQPHFLEPHGLQPDWRACGLAWRTQQVEARECRHGASWWLLDCRRGGCSSTITWYRS